MDPNPSDRVGEAVKSSWLVIGLCDPRRQPNLIFLSRIFLKLENLQPSGSFKSR